MRCIIIVKFKNKFDMKFILWIMIKIYIINNFIILIKINFKPL